MPLLGLAVAGYLLLGMGAELRYWVRELPAVDLGEEGAWHLERAADDVPATARGTPAPGRVREERWSGHYELLALRGTNLVVRRTLAGKAPTAAAANAGALRVEGRLLRDDSAPEYARAFRALSGRGGAVPREGHLYLLLDGEMPRSGWRVPAVLAGLAGLVLLDARWLWLALRRRAG